MSMRAFVTLRNNEYCRAGTYWVGDYEGLFLAELARTGKHEWKLQQKGHVMWPFENLAPYIVELGFQIDREIANAHRGSIPRDAISTNDEIREQIQFQEENADIIEPELERRQRRLDPSYRESWKATKETSKDDEPDPSAE